MQFAIRKTSRERFWTGFEAATYDTSGGFVESPLLTKHHVIMRFGAPTMATCRCGGLLHRGLEVPGDIDVVPIGFSGSWDDDGPTSIIVVTISPSLIRTASDGMGLGTDCASIAPQLQLKDPRLAHIMWALKAELETEEPLGRLYADSLGLALSAHLLRRYAPVQPGTLRGGLSQRRLQRVMDYIHEHLAQDLSLGELADVVNMSSSHFKSLFKQSVGVPVHQYVIERRVEYAAALLLSSTLPPSDVALQAGFANQSHMARCMRRVTGMTPSVLLREVS